MNRSGCSGKVAAMEVLRDSEKLPSTTDKLVRCAIVLKNKTTNSKQEVI